jgi:diguanylate cyclase (GGDEF)-like protein
MKGDGVSSSESTVVREGDARGEGAGIERRRASRALWQACEALLSVPADPETLDLALDALRQAFECDGVALNAIGAAGHLEPWCATGVWETAAGDLRDCVTVPLFRGAERTGSLDLQARPGQRWKPAQLGLVRTASGALGSALGARLELERLRQQPGRDSVTGLPDARAFHERLTEELARSRRHGPPLALLHLEIDHFDALEKRYGRDVADSVLAETALVLKLALRESDATSRVEAGRFAIVLPETDAGPALRCAERVRRTLEEHRFARVGHVSASAGLATSPRDGLEAVELLHRADQALAIARKSGHRRVAGSGSALAH